MKYCFELPETEPINPERVRMGVKYEEERGFWNNGVCFMRDGKPFIPIMGEFHFSRYPCAFWRKELLKMKSAGINTVSSYVFWNHHEEIKGEFDWSGDRNLREFIKTAGDCGLYVWLRIGPWCHGEARYGGFPDWVQSLPETRCNAPEYLAYADRYYTQISEQANGLYYADGGPVIGVQIENEYVETGLGKGKEHMLALKRLAVKNGILPVFFSMTGWGETELIDELMPLNGQYPEMPWEQHTHEIDPNFTYFFRPFIPKTKDRLWPVMCCELGGGVQITSHRRPILRGRDVSAAIFCILGSGDVMPGYYVFHGGTNPDGKKTTLQESRETGYANDVPVKSYDFQAPLGEYGEARPWLSELALMHLFIETFTSLLAESETVFADVPDDPADMSVLRRSVRYAGKSGFVFLNAYQRHKALPDRDRVEFGLDFDGERFSFPFFPADFPSGVYAALPFNIDLGGVTLRHATCQPITKTGEGGRTTWFFFSPGNMSAELAFYAENLAEVACENGAVIKRDGCYVVSGLTPGTDAWLDVTCHNGRRLSVCVLDEASALGLRKGVRDKNILLLPKDTLIWQDGEAIILSRKSTHFETLVYPVAGEIDGWKTKAEGRFTKATGNVPTSGGIGIETAFISDSEGWEIQIQTPELTGIDELFLVIEYEGDRAELRLGGRLIADNFYDGRPWRVGLKRFLGDKNAHRLQLRVKRLDKNADIYFEPGYRPEGELFGLKNAEIEISYIKTLYIR